MGKPHAPFLAGMVGGLMLDKEALVIFLVGIVVGAAAGFLVREAVAAGRWVRRKLEEPRPYDYRKPW